MTADRPSATRRRFVLAAIAVVVVLCCWIVATPRNGGPDEPSHAVFSAALIRGELSVGELLSDSRPDTLEVPAMVGSPNPACWAFQPFVSVGCASLDSSSTELEPRFTRATDYSPWAYVLPSLASLVPSATAYMYLARVLMAAIPAVLVIAAFGVLGRSRPGLRAAALLGLTPIAWFTMSIVNPSAIAIAGGFALWVALVTPAHRRHEVLLLASWTAVILPRRDGPLWATAIVVMACLAVQTTPRRVWRDLRPGTRWGVVAVGAVPPLVTAVVNPGLLDVVLASTPLLLLAVDPIHDVVERSAHPRRVVGVGAALAALVTVVGLQLTRQDGLEGHIVRSVFANTGDHLRELVGVLSWLDAPVPTTAILLFWATIGALVALAWVDDPRRAHLGVAMILLTVALAWVLELGQGSDLGTYWQGRYSIPFTVGLPMLLALRPGGGTSSDPVDRLAPAIAVIAWLIWNAGFLAAMQRWGVGIGGSWWPHDWDTWGAPLPAWLLAVVHALATAALAAAVVAPAQRAPVAVADARQPV